MSAFGDNLKAARLAKGMTLVQCANALGITNPALSQWEQGKREPKHSMLVALCRLLDTTPNDLLGVSPPSSSVAVRGSAVSPGRQPTTNSPTRNSPTTNYQLPTTKSAPGTLPQCARCEHRKLAEKMRKMLGGG